MKDRLRSRAVAWCGAGFVTVLTAGCERGLAVTPPPFAAVLSGTVVTPAGQPVQGAMLDVRLLWPSPVPESSMGACIGTQVGFDDITATDASGRFAVVLEDYGYPSVANCVAIRVTPPAAADWPMTVFTIPGIRLRVDPSGLRAIRDTIRRVLVVPPGGS